MAYGGHVSVRSVHGLGREPPELKNQEGSSTNDSVDTNERTLSTFGILTRKQYIYSCFAYKLVAGSFSIPTTRPSDFIVFFHLTLSSRFRDCRDLVVFLLKSKIHARLRSLQRVKNTVRHTITWEAME